jgi:hypothetical protein
MTVAMPGFSSWVVGCGAHVDAGSFSSAFAMCRWRDGLEEELVTDL